MMTRSDVCRCGGTIVAETGEEAAAVYHHVRSAVHREWRERSERRLPCPIEGCATITPGGRVCHYHRAGR